MLRTTHPPRRAPRRTADGTGKSSLESDLHAAVPATPSINDLIEGYRRPGRATYPFLLERFAAYQKANVIEEQFARSIHAGAVLLRREVGTHSEYEIKVAYESGSAPPEFGAVVRGLRGLEREASVVVDPEPRKVVVKDIYTELVYLLGVLDCERATASTRMKAAIRSSEKALGNLRSRVRAHARRRALRYYLAGLPVGLAIGLGLAAILAHWTGLAPVLLQCVVSGMIGAAVSVMVRVTSGKGIDVDAAQNRLMGVVAGAFRPLVGAVFGAVLYVLVTGQLLPLATPQKPEIVGLFFVGLAFLAGFSERWAQDTIVQSTPRVANGRKERPDTP